MPFEKKSANCLTCVYCQMEDRDTVPEEYPHEVYCARNPVWALVHAGALGDAPPTEESFTHWCGEHEGRE